MIIILGLRSRNSSGMISIIPITNIHVCHMYMYVFVAGSSRRTSSVESLTDNGSILNESGESKLNRNTR